MNPTLATFTVRALVAISLAAAFFLLWKVIDVVVLAFGGIIVAVMLRIFTDFLARHAHLRDTWALAITIAALLVLLALIMWLLQARLSAQVHQMIQALPESWQRARATIGRSPLGATLIDGLQSMIQRAESGGLIARIATSTFNAVTNLVLIPFLGLFLAAAPRTYTGGLVALVPRGGRAQFSDALDATAQALSHWLLGVLASMICIGVATGLGLWALGIPLALSLGILAGLLEFIPFIGPILSSIPAILIAFMIGPTRAAEVVALYVAIQQLESYVLVPIFQRKAVSLPPALTIIAVVVFGLIFGMPGVIFATPLMVATKVLVQKLYVERLERAGE